jgi:hypothetical protein
MAQRGLDDVEAALCREWHGIRDSASIASTLAAEHMRALIYAASAHYGQLGAVPTIHTTRLLASARRALGLVWPHYGSGSAAPDICEGTLEQMQALGDAVDTGSGQWLAAPVRIVAAKDSSSYLLVSPAPIQAVHRLLGMQLTCAATSRFVGEAVFEAKGNKDLVLSMDAWLGHNQSLVSWTAHLLAHYEAHMETVEGLSAEDLELYAPDVIQAQRRSGRWIAAGQIGRALDGPRLCRPQEGRVQKWDRPFYLAHFGYKDGVLTLQRVAQVPADLTLRLRFGLDTIMRTRRRISIVRQRDTFSIDRPPMLPSPESRVYALGWKAASQDNPERLTFHANAMPFVLHALERLAVSAAINGGTV